MRENRTYGSEGGEAKAFPTPIAPMTPADMNIMPSYSNPPPQVPAIRALIALIARFGLAGLINTGIGFAVIAGLDVGLHVSPPLANAAGYLVGMGVGFVLNRRFVFKSQTSARATAPRYIAVVIAAFALNQLILHAAGASLGQGAVPHLAAQLCGMAVYTLAVFVACRFWVFRVAG